PIRDVDVAAPVGRHAGGGGELSVARPRAPPDGEQGAACVELLDAVVEVLCHVHVPASVGRQAGGVAELSPGGAEGAVRVELLDAAVARVGDVDVPAGVGRHGGGVVELPAAGAAAVEHVGHRAACGAGRPAGARG